MDISGSIATVTGLSKLTKLIIDGKVDKRAKEIAIELHDSILPLQQMLSSLHSKCLSLQIEKSNIQEEITKLHNWREKASQYKLKELAPNVLVYTHIIQDGNTQPNHHICAKCYKESMDYILTATEPQDDGTHYYCSNCETTIIDYSNKRPETVYVTRPPENY